MSLTVLYIFSVLLLINEKCPLDAAFVVVSFSYYFWVLPPPSLFLVKLLPGCMSKLVLILNSALICWPSTLPNEEGLKEKHTLCSPSIQRERDKFQIILQYWKNITNSILILIFHEIFNLDLSIWKVVVFYTYFE